MASAPMVQRDERTIAVENASYRSAYLFLSYGILALVAYRSFVLHESGWDLLALVILGGVVTTAYQGIHGVSESAVGGDLSFDRRHRRCACGRDRLVSLKLWLASPWW